MASGFVAANGEDLDSVFALFQSDWPQAALTDYDTADTDLNARYAALASGTAAAATGFVAPNGDLNTYFAAAGSTSVVVETQPSAVSGSATAGNPSGTVISGTTTCAGAKGKGSYTYAWEIVSGSASPTAANSATSGVTGNIPAGTTWNGTWRCLISDGTTSAYTDTVDWSLTNTTAAVFDFTLVAAQTGPDTVGYAGAYGSISDADIDSDHTITGVIFNDQEEATFFQFVVQGASSAPPPDYFDYFTYTVDGESGPQFAAANATYETSGNAAIWTWYNTDVSFEVGGSYPCSLNF